MYSYTPRGVCAKSINIELDGDKISYIDFEGGCNGNLKAIAKMVAGKTVDEVAEQLEGLTCGPRLTSCADQMVKGLREAQQQQ